MKCPICAQVCQGFKDPLSQINYCHCHHCCLIFKSSEHYQDFDTQKKRYDLHQNNEESEGYRAYFGRFLDFVLPLAPGVRNALDYGCGATSLLASMLSERGIASDSYDPIYRPDLSYRKKYYDLIVSVEVFEHLHDPLNTFTHLLSRLSPGGYLAIQTEFHPGDEDQFLQWYYRLDPTHIIFFRPETFRYLAKLLDCHYIDDNGKNMLVVQKSKSLTAQKK